MSQSTTELETPISSANTKKRELSSPEFSLDIKKNKPSSLSSESDLEISDLSDITALPPITEMASSDTSESAGSAGSSHIVIPPSELSKISEMLKDTFRGEIVNLVDSVVQGVLKGINDRIASLEARNSTLESQNTALMSRVAVLEKAADQAEQYSRRNNIRISGCPEVANEDTDNIVLKMASDIGCDLQLHEIDRSHRVGKPGENRTRPREIIVKFTSYRARQKLYKMRVALKDHGYQGTFLNEDLTQYRSKLLYEARKVVKAERAKVAWSSDGNILIKDFGDIIHRLNTANDLLTINFPPKPGVPMQ